MDLIFDTKLNQNLKKRFNQLKPETPRKWGKMDCPQMLTHCNLAMESAFDDNQPRPNFLVRAMVRLFVKSTLIGDRPYKQGSPTAPSFVVKDTRDFQKEKTRALANLDKFEKEGRAFFEGRPHPALGPLTAAQWSRLQSKHLEHHLNQFGV